MYLFLARHLRLFLGFCFLFISAVAFFQGVLLAHVIAFFGLAVPTGPFFVVNMTLSVHPYHAWPTARSWSAGGRRSGLFRR